MAESANAVGEMELGYWHLHRHIHPRIVVETYRRNLLYSCLSRQARLRLVNHHPKGYRQYACVEHACASQEEEASHRLALHRMVVGPRINYVSCAIQRCY